jgi:acyl-CoA thioesterase-1
MHDQKNYSYLVPILTAVFLALIPLAGYGQESDSVKVKKILFLGNSLTAGFGIQLEEAYPALIQQKIDSLELPYKTINAGLSGETTSGGLRRLRWLLNDPPAVLVIALGGNDGLRGISPKLSKDNIRNMVNIAREVKPDMTILLAGMEVPTNLGEQYRQQFREIYPQLAKEMKLVLIPFLLENVGGIPELNLPDGIHPNVDGQKIVTRNVWKILEPIIIN